MEWNDVNDLTKEIPFTKVCVWDGGNTFWAYLVKIEIFQHDRKLIWNVIKPEGYPDTNVLKWIKITEPN